MSRFLLFAIGVLTLACGPRHSRLRTATSPEPVVVEISKLPRLGQRAPAWLRQCDQHAGRYIASSQVDESCDVLFSGRKFTVCRRSGKVSCLVTSDAAFLTPEGVKVLDSYSNAKLAGASPITCEPGRACYGTLPSGWSFAFSPLVPSADGERLEESPPPDDDTRIIWFFQR